jgi:hypothetical protein
MLLVEMKKIMHANFSSELNSTKCYKLQHCLEEVKLVCDYA